MGLNQETLLYKSLFGNGYNPKIRPVKDSRRTVTVGLEFELMAIADLVVFSSLIFQWVMAMTMICNFRGLGVGSQHRLHPDPTQSWAGSIHAILKNHGC